MGFNPKYYKLSQQNSTTKYPEIQNCSKAEQKAMYPQENNFLYTTASLLAYNKPTI